MKPLVLCLAAMAAGAQVMKMPDLDELNRKMERFARVELKVDTAGLAEGDRRALAKLVEAAHVVDQVFMTQLWDGNAALLAKLEEDKAPLGQARLRYFLMNKGPWSDLDAHQAFVPGVPQRKPLGANFYPADMTREEFEEWVKTLPADQKAAAEGFFTVIRRDASRRLHAVPYSTAYRTYLGKLSTLLREAAAATPNATLKRFLTLRAAAFQSDDYYESDVAWMDLDAPLEITIGPYETYNDELFGYKAAFEAYVTLRDAEETDKLKFFAKHLQEVENNLPIDKELRNPKLGALAPIRVVNEIVSAGDGAHGVRTAAYNLPNDERVVREKGAKRVMLKNVQEAKFNSILVPIAARVLPEGAREELSFDSFFTHILAHELSHGLGPMQVKGKSTPRQELKEQYSAIEEAKADATGLFVLQYMYDNGLLKGGADAERKLYTTFLASAFRSLRFGVHEAHGRGMALQMNYLMDKGAFTVSPGGTFAVDFTKIKPAIRDLVHDLLMLEANGDYDRAKKMLGDLAVVRPVLQKALDGLTAIPTDIEPAGR